FSARKIRTRRGLGALRVCRIFMGRLPVGFRAILSFPAQVRSSGAQARHTFMPCVRRCAGPRLPRLRSLPHSRDLKSLPSTKPGQVLSTANSCPMSELQECAASGAAAAGLRMRVGANGRRDDARQKVREIRARLAHGPGAKPDFEYELLCMFAR